MKAKTEKTFVQMNYKLREGGRDLKINVSKEAMSQIKRAAPARLVAVKHALVNSFFCYIGSKIKSWQNDWFPNTRICWKYVKAKQSKPPVLKMATLLSV